MLYTVSFLTVALGLGAHALSQPGVSPNYANGLTITKRSEFCGTDADGVEWYCDDPSTTCCLGSQVWSCAPITATECCDTGYYCENGSACVIDENSQQWCLEVEDTESGGVQTTHSVRPTTGLAVHSTTGAARATASTSGAITGTASSSTGLRTGGPTLPPLPGSKPNVAVPVTAGAFWVVAPLVAVLAGMVAL